MKRSIVTLIFAVLSVSGIVHAQNQYEVEYLTNPNPGKKDTRQVNAILNFGGDKLQIRSRRSNELFKEFKYADIISVEHSYKKKPMFSLSTGSAIALTVMTGLPVFLIPRGKERHWLNIVSDSDFAVLKIENDNYRMIKMECLIRDLKLTNVNEGKE